MAPRILIFFIAMGADYSFEVKNIEIWVPAFFKHNNSSVATVYRAVHVVLVSLFDQAIAFPLSWIFCPVFFEKWSLSKGQ